jgi:hypothetical protein
VDIAPAPHITVIRIDRSPCTRFIAVSGAMHPILILDPATLHGNHCFFRRGGKP